MIKINLATKKQSGLVTETKTKSSSKAFSTQRITLQQFRELPVGKLVMVGLACFAVNMILDTYMSDELQKVDDALAKIIAGNAKAQQDLLKYKKYDEVKKSLDTDDLLVKTKLEVIQKLVLGRSESLKLLLSISSSIPKDVWLKELKMEKGELLLRGSSVGFSAISDFMKRLHDGPYFSSVDLIDTQESKEGRDNGIANFELSAKRR